MAQVTWYLPEVAVVLLERGQLGQVLLDPRSRCLNAHRVGNVPPAQHEHHEEQAHSGQTHETQCETIVPPTERDRRHLAVSPGSCNETSERYTKTSTDKQTHWLICQTYNCQNNDSLGARFESRCCRQLGSRRIAGSENLKPTDKTCAEPEKYTRWNGLGGTGFAAMLTLRVCVCTTCCKSSMTRR